MLNFKNILVIILLCIVSISFINCASRIIKQTSDSAVIQGVGATKIEAKINAEEEAKKLFPKYKIVNEPDFTQEYEVDDNGKRISGETYWSCVIEVKKSE